MRHSHLWRLVSYNNDKPFTLPAFRCVAKILMPTLESSRRSHQKSSSRLRRRRQKIFLFLTLLFVCYANIFMPPVVVSWHLTKHGTSCKVKIWSTSITLNPASLWITINPCDLHDPIAQVFCGEEIDLDQFIAAMGPSKETRAHNITLDPHSAAKFFHFMIETILRTLFGVERSKY